MILLLHQLFVTLMENDSITRGHNLKIFKERCRLNIRNNSFIFRSTDVWNSLPQSVVDAPSVQSFEVRIDKLGILQSRPASCGYTVISAFRDLGLSDLGLFR